jgi:hypothetical protein
LNASKERLPEEKRLSIIHEEEAAADAKIVEELKIDD